MIKQTNNNRAARLGLGQKPPGLHVIYKACIGLHKPWSG